MVKRLLKWGTACAAIWLAACTDPNAARRQQLATEMEILTEQISVASQAVEHERDKITFFESQMRVKEAELADYRGKVNAYLLNHKMALAAIALGVGGTSVAIDTSNEFSQDAQAAASIGAFFAGMYALSNAEEVAEVADVLMQADSRIKTLESEISGFQSNYSTEMPLLAEREKSLQTLNAQYLTLKSEVDALAER